MITQPIRLALFASGQGTNVQRIAEYFQGRTDVVADCLLYNVVDAPVARRAQLLGLPAYYFTNTQFADGHEVSQLLQQRGIHYIILAGFLRLVPAVLLKEFPGRIVNIHPALLPNYGGKGMYGHFVHEAVVANREPYSGITIHVVDQHFDRGTILFQARCPLSPADTPAQLAAKVAQLEQRYFPQVIDQFVSGQPILPQEE